ncbi:MAG: hypothetical protein CM1200mP30_00550 [Pseudomonadota bacterium]|nr:MAG: hypothetical protein CM1200mP30_00550 [Pseudomonadota bacterium]
MLEDEPGSFFLTDFLVKSFEKFKLAGIENKQPSGKFLKIYFRHYKRLVYLAQTERKNYKLRPKKLQKDWGFVIRIDSTDTED